MSRTITQRQVLALCTSMGACSVTDLLAPSNKPGWFIFKERGVSVQASFPNGWVLSVQGGDGMYSDPRAKAGAYTELECAILGTKAPDDNGSKCKLFYGLMDSGIMNGCETVACYMDVTRLPELVEFVRDLPTEVDCVAQDLFCDGYTWDSDDDKFIPIKPAQPGGN